MDVISVHVDELRAKAFSFRSSHYLIARPSGDLDRREFWRRLEYVPPAFLECGVKHLARQVPAGGFPKDVPRPVASIGLSPEGKTHVVGPVAAHDVVGETRRVSNQQHNREVRMKFTPQLRFELDHSIEKGDAVLAILDKLPDAGDGEHS